MSGTYWYQKPLRMVQSVLREPDIIDYDAADVVRYLERVGANVMIVNGGGVIDYFPNQTHLARRNRFLGEQDWLAELIEACHEKDIKVLTRLDFRGVDPQRYEQQPDWFAQDQNGNPHVLWKFIRRPCYTGEYANGHAAKYIRQLMSRYNIDGIWQNCLNFGIGPCYCKSCRDLYREETGHEVPTDDDYTAPVFSEYRDWKARHADRHMNLMRSTVKSFGDDKAYCAEIFGMFHVGNAVQTGIDLYNAKNYFDFLLSPAFQDGSAHPSRKYDHLNSAASTVRFLKSIDTSKQAVMLYGNNATKWRYIKSPSLETRLWLWETLSVGGGFWNCLFNGQNPAATVDIRNAYIEKDAFHYHRKHEKLLDDQQPLMDVGVYYSKPSRDANGHDEEEKDNYGTCINGVERVLTDYHVQYNFINDLDFSLAKIRPLKTLIMPNATHLSDAHIEILRQYVREGGGLIASYQTSLYDENGKPRPDFGLADLFDVSFTGMSRDTTSDCYQLVRQGDHPVLADMQIEKTHMIMNEDQTLLCRHQDSGDSKVLCTYIPQIYNQPPEFAWLPKLETDYPTIVVKEYGKGRVVYFANQTDKSCYTNGHEDFCQSFYNAIRWTAQNDLSIETTAPESVHIALTEKSTEPGNYILSLVNHTGGSRRPLQNLVPVSNIRVTVKLPQSAQLKSHQILHQEGKINVKAQGTNASYIELSFAKIEEFAAVHLTAE